MNEIIYIVDENDNIIGKKERGTETKDDFYRVSALWLTNSEGEILLAKKGLCMAHHPGKWGPAVAGTVAEGESYEDNIIKETKEELGLKNIEFKKGPKIRALKDHPHFTQWFLAEIDKDINDFKFDKEDVVEIRWISKEDLKKEAEDHPEIFLKSVHRWIEEFC